jgi:hypothetical protein
VLIITAYNKIKNFDNTKQLGVNKKVKFNLELSKIFILFYMKKTHLKKSGF